MSISLSVKNIHNEIIDGEYTVKADIDTDGDVSEVYFTSQEINTGLQKLGDPYLCSMLLPAMKIGAKLIIDAPVSRSLYEKASTIIQDIYFCWDRSLHRIEIEAIIEEDSNEELRSEASFFSGGLDSLYTLNKHKDSITHTAFVWGFDIPLENEKLWNESKNYLNDAAGRYDKTPIYVKTNVKKWAEQYVDWGMYHGGALAAIGHFISGSVGKIYIGSSHTFENLFPWGSHYILDPLWSTLKTEFVHDGCEATRVEKAEAISNDQVALDIIRVCYKNPKGAYNCGKCDKCLRTMMNLKAVGALDKCKTLPHQLDYKKISGAEILNESALSFFLENLEAAKRTGQVELSSALNEAISNKGRYHFKTIFRNYVMQPIWLKTPKFIKNIIRFSIGRPVDQ